jgi:hypothetical protein
MDPTDAAALVMTIFVAILACWLSVAARRISHRPRTLHAVPLVDRDGQYRAAAVYATSEEDAVRRARRLVGGPGASAAPPGHVAFPARFSRWPLTDS